MTAPPQPPKRHHYLPQCYINAWADADGVVAVRRRDGARPFTTHTKNIGLEVGLHGQGSDAAARETVFGQFEQDWPRLRTQLVGGGALSNDERDLVSLFTAVQWARTRESILRREFVADIAAFTDERPLSQDAVRQYLAERHLGFPPEDAEAEGAWTIASYVIEQEHIPTRDESLAQAFDFAVKEVAPRIRAMSWTLEQCRKPILITSDRPVMLWRPRSHRDRFEGIGWDTAEEVRFPLTPSDLLRLRRGAPGLELENVKPKRFDKVNGETAAQCFECVIGTVRKKTNLTELRMAKRRPSARFNAGPLIAGDGSVTATNDVVQFYVPIRDDL